MATGYSCVLPCDGQTKVTLILFRNVTNCKELRQIIKDGKLNASLLKTQTILDKFQVLAAVNRAVNRKMTNTMTTRSLFTEIIYSMSATKNISDSLTTFGISDNDSSVLAVLIDSSDISSNLQKLTEVVKGEPSPIEDLGVIAEPATVKKVYKIREEELQNATLLNSVVNRIATKDLVSF